MVASDGPPAVRSQTCSKAFAVQIEDSSVVMMMTGRMPGTVTFQNRCQLDAPSTMAASCSSLGTDWRAARMEMNQNGKPRQTEAMITELMAVCRVPSQSTTPE